MTTETNPAHEAEKITSQAAADAAKLGTTVKTDATAAIGDIEEVEVGAQSMVKTDATTAEAAVRTAQARAQADIAAAKT